MPQNFIIEDRSGSRIIITHYTLHQARIVFSGRLVTGEPRRANVKGFFMPSTARDFKSMRDKLFENKETVRNFCRNAVPDENSYIQIPELFSLGIFSIGYHNNQFYIETRNTVGRRCIIFDDPELIFQFLGESFVQAGYGYGFFNEPYPAR